MESACCYAASFFCRYLFSWSAFFTHIVSFGLLFSLAKQNVNVGQFIHTAVRFEVVQLVLWLFVPMEKLAVVLALWYCLNAYQKAVGIQVTVFEKTTLISEVDVELWLKHVGEIGALKDVRVTSDAEGRHILDTPLRCARPVTIGKAAENGEADPVCLLELNLIKSAQGGCQPVLMYSLRNHGARPDCCITLDYGAGRDSQAAVLIADSAAACDEWLSLLHQITGTSPESIEKQWLKKLVSADWVTSSDGKGDTVARQFGVDEAYSVLLKAKRNADKNYLTELLKSIAKASERNGKGRTSSDAKLSIEEFAALFRQTAFTPGVLSIFSRLQLASSGRSSITAKTFLQFISSQQKEQMTMDALLQWIMNNEPVLTFGNLSVAGFANYLIAEDNSVFNRKHRVVYQDMRQPLCHYFIATSHNTYLTKDQLKSKSSVDAYINALKRGCKCLELDCWDGPNSEPIIYHGHTLTSKILFKDVIQAIKDYAFCVSRYPVILSFENHCSVEQQRVMAAHLKNILGDVLHTEAIPEDQICLPSPEDLQGYVLVKAKKLRVGEPEDDIDDDFSDDDITEEELNSFADRHKNSDDLADTISMRSDDIDEDETASTDQTGDRRKFSTLKGLMQTMHTVDIFRKQKKEEVKVPKIAQELSELVTYCQATGFRSFEHSRNNCKHYEMSSFGEKKAMKFAREIPSTFLRYNQRQLSRTYPAGVRIDSSNYDPLPLWTVGCQMVALNYQTPCREMQLNQGLFQDNGGCGYVLKPQFMRQENITFDPRASPTDVYTLTIKEIRGFQIPYKSDRAIKSDRSLVVQVKTAGVECDNQLQRTNPVKNNGFSPAWEENLTFKLHVPDLVLVHFGVYTKDSFIAQFTLPFTSIMQGYRKIPLQNKFSEPLPNAYLLANISIQTPI